MTEARLPLCLGPDGLWQSLRGSSMLFVGAIFVAGGAVGGWGHGAKVAVCAFGLVLVALGVASLVRAWRRRPSDVLLLPEGIAVEGGRCSGLHLSWLELSSGELRLDDTSEHRVTLAGLVFGLLVTWLDGAKGASAKERVRLHRLVYRPADGAPLVLAEVEHSAEVESLRALFESLRNRLGEPGDEAEPNAPGLFRCENCASPMTPIDAEVATCHSCDHKNPVPPALRQKLADQASSQGERRDNELVIGRLLRQPGARKATAVSVLFALLSTLPWTAAVASLLYTGMHLVGGFEVGWAMVGAFVTALSLFLWARAALVKRRALQLLAVEFAAHGSSQCRQCRGPLSAGDDSLVVRCAYCDADNVLGINMGKRARQQSAQKSLLTDVLAGQRKERRNWRALALVALLLGAVAIIMNIAGVVVAREFAAAKVACDEGDANACLSVATDLYLGISASENPELAAEYARRACDLKSAEGCQELSDYYYFGSGVEADMEQSNALRSQACEMGHQPSCEARP